MFSQINLFSITVVAQTSRCRDYCFICFRPFSNGDFLIKISKATKSFSNSKAELTMIDAVDKWKKNTKQNKVKLTRTS